MLANKYQKPEDFIGWKSPDGKLEVIGIADKTGKHGLKLFKVTCKICSQDTELFPDGYFVMSKGNLLKGGIPCGCSSCPKLKEPQCLIKAKRAGKRKNFIVHGFAEEFNGNTTKMICECPIHSYTWKSSFTCVVNRSSGCPKCAGTYKPTEQEALEKCQKICDEMNYSLVGFPDGYKNNISKFEYICKTHGKQSVSYHSFICVGNRCSGCAPRPVLTERQAMSRCEEICKQENYKSIGFVGGYIGTRHTLFEYICPIHDEQKVSYKHFVNQGVRCPSCADCGYNPDKSGSFYVVEWTKEGHTFLKFGITNRDVITRLNEQAKETRYTYKVIFQQLWEDGKIADSLEKAIKHSKLFEMGVVNKEDFKDGYTETVNSEDLYKLLEYIQLKVKQT